MKAPEYRYPPQPPLEPYKPKREHYNTEGATETQIVYHDVSVIGDCEIDLEEHFADMEEELPKPSLPHNEITLQDIMNLAPSGAKLSDIRLNISYPRMAEYLEVKFIYSKRDLEAEEQAFLHAKEEYAKEHIQFIIDMGKYKKQLAEFQAWEKEQEIKHLEKKLSDLRK